MGYMMPYACKFKGHATADMIRDAVFFISGKCVLAHYTLYFRLNRMGYCFYKLALKKWFM